MDFKPTLRYENSGELTLAASSDSARVAAFRRQSTTASVVKSAVAVIKDSKARIIQVIIKRSIVTTELHIHTVHFLVFSSVRLLL